MISNMMVALYFYWGSEAAPLSRAGRERHRHAVHAIAQASRFRAVVEHVAQMAAAAAAVDFGAQHAEGAVGGGADGVVQRLPETRPAGVAFKLGARREQRQRAAGAGEFAGAVFVVEWAGERPLGAFAAQHVELRAVEQLVPLVVAVHDFKFFQR